MTSPSYSGLIDIVIGTGSGTLQYYVGGGAGGFSENAGWTSASSDAFFWSGLGYERASPWCSTFATDSSRVACLVGHATGSVVFSDGCTAGEYMHTGDSNCYECPAGSYSTSGNVTACTSCSTGTYVSTPSATSCVNCAVGSYSSLTGSIACSSCAAGSYNTETGATSCVFCSAGYFQSETGSASCTACCSAGKFLDTSAMGTVSCDSLLCEECLPGQYSGDGATRSLIMR